MLTKQVNYVTGKQGQLCRVRASLIKKFINICSECFITERYATTVTKTQLKDTVESFFDCATTWSRPQSKILSYKSCCIVRENLTELVVTARK